MINAPYEKEFVFHDGQRAKNLLELSVIIEKISQQDFERFVNPDKNDFANWTEYVLQDRELAASLRSTVSLPKTKELINNRLIIEENSASSLNNGPKKPLFKIFSQKKEQQVVELRKPIAKLPEPEHHVIELLPEHIPENRPKKGWFGRKDIKKDNSLRKWYEFKKNTKKIAEETHPVDNHRGNIFWIFIYGALILMILFLVLYKFVF